LLFDDGDGSSDRLLLLSCMFDLPACQWSHVDNLIKEMTYSGQPNHLKLWLEQGRPPAEIDSSWNTNNSKMVKDSGSCYVEIGLFIEGTGSVAAGAVSVRHLSDTIPTDRHPVKREILPPRSPLNEGTTLIVAIDPIQSHRP